MLLLAQKIRFTGVQNICMQSFFPCVKFSGQPFFSRVEFPGQPFSRFTFSASARISFHGGFVLALMRRRLGQGAGAGSHCRLRSCVTENDKSDTFFKVVRALMKAKALQSPFTLKNQLKTLVKRALKHGLNIVKSFSKMPKLLYKLKK